MCIYVHQVTMCTTIYASFEGSHYIDSVEAQKHLEFFMILAYKYFISKGVQFQNIRKLAFNHLLDGPQGDYFYFF
jgi:hypothetical protein